LYGPSCIELSTALISIFDYIEEDDSHEHKLKTNEMT
jgi:hypothetical protein